ncbi:heme exporter protein CcmD [Sphaerotilus hippei]|uniref:Heme exporter protein D n=1 Tax=Sphaerotilus hippei TaxID=744406 RepID=A0A318H6U8_9BURK|nr:heme exporter protein CcmD [Sphaerotilus hippei]PXW93375.1 heme exporter protein CcmD [Sphaerotilus hippei]
MPDLMTPWWPDLATFLRMGRHGPYVWSALAVCALALAAEGWSLRQRARRLHQLEREQR